MKKRKKIYSTSDLPRWFSLEAYSPVAQFGADEWARAIAARLSQRREHGDGQQEYGAHWWLRTKAHGKQWEVGINHPERFKVETVLSKGFETTFYQTDGIVTAFGASIPESLAGYSPENTERFADIRAAEITRDRELLDSLSHLNFHILFGDSVASINAPTSVSPLSRGVAYSFYLGSKSRTEIDTHWAALRPLGQCEDKENEAAYRAARQWFAEPYEGLSGCALGVSLHATDEQLIADFTAWLKHKRSEYRVESRTKRFTHDDFAKWRAYQLLAYFDLSYWAELEGITISADAMVNALFPAQDGNPAEIIKRQRLWCSKVFTGETAQALALQSGSYIL